MQTIKKILILFFIVFISNLSAQKVAYVSESKILAEIKDYEKNTKELERLKNDYTSQISKEAEEINIKLEKIIKNYNPKDNETYETIKSRMKQADVEKLEILNKEKELIGLKAINYKTSLEEFYKNKIQPELDKVNNAINSYAKKNKFVMIYKFENISSDLAYIDEKLDKTQDIIQLIKQ